MQKHTTIVLVGLAAIGLSGVSWAEQATPPPSTQQCPEDNSKKPPTDNPSDRLAETKGVVCPPPGIDPAIEKKPPADGKLKVIPPPGTPGGNPNVEPK